MRRIEAVIAILAFVVAMVVAGAVYMLVEKPTTPAGLAFRCPPPPEFRDIYIAKQPIAVAEMVEDSVITEKWPINAIRQDFFSPDNAKDLKRYIAQRHIAAGEPITSSSVVDAKDRGKLAALVREGYRAVSINVDQATAGSGLISPGDIVDVILTYTPKGSDQATSQTVLCNVRILAFDQRMGNSISGVTTAVNNVIKDVVPRTATLEVKPNQAESLTSAVKIGVASLSLHSTRDKKRKKCREELFVKAPESIKIVRGDPLPESNGGANSGTGNSAPGGSNEGGNSLVSAITGGLGSVSPMGGKQ